MQPAASHQELLYSPLALESDLAEIVAMFVDELPDRLDRVHECLQCSDWEGLARAAHQLKGAAGSYGFPQITRSAARVEEAAREHLSEEMLLTVVQELGAMCSRARPGTPDRSATTS